MLRSTAHPAPDAELEAAIAAGDKNRALTLLMERHGDSIHHFAISITGDPQLAEDVRQQVFVEALRDLDQVEHVSAFQGWLLGIARHRCIDALNARKKWYQRYKNETPDDGEPASGDPGDGPGFSIDQELDRVRLSRILEICVGKLAPAVRHSVVLRYVMELAYDEVAEVVDDAAGTVQRRVARALPTLRRCVENHLRGGLR